MIELMVFGLLLGWGAAIPIGAINLEIIRRNLQYGTSTGVALGMGACMADLTYLVLLSYGALQLLGSPFLLKLIGVMGSLILFWFGWTALRQRSNITWSENAVVTGSKPLAKHTRDGYLLTLINPYSIIFWCSISATIAANTKTDNATIYAGTGVLLGALSWVFVLNMFVHLTRHRMSSGLMKKMNVTGGIILIFLALMGLYRSLLLSF